MKKTILTIGALSSVVLPIISLVSCSSSIANKESVKITDWPDGDSPHVTRLKDGSKMELRLVGFDTPEVHDQFNGMQTMDKSKKFIEYYFGEEAHKIAEKLFPADSKPEAVYDTVLDEYGRSLSVLLINGKDNFGTYMIKHGLARRAYTDANAFSSKWETQDAAAYKYAFDHNLGFWDFVKNGKIPTDASDDFKTEASTLKTTADRIHHVFTKMRSGDGSQPDWLYDWYANNK